VGGETPSARAVVVELERTAVKLAEVNWLLTQVADEGDWGECAG